MKRIHNPHTAPVKIRFGEPGKAVGYEIPAGATMDFTEEFYPVADYFVEIYGFLTLEEVELSDEENELACKKCGKVCKNKAGLSAHERNCKVTKATPVAKVEDKRHRSNKEDDGFIDMPEIVSGPEREEVVGGRVQKIVYDRDGIGWYGPGIENDITPQSNRRPGQF